MKARSTERHFRHHGATAVVLEPCAEEDSTWLCAAIRSPAELLEWAGPGFVYPLTPAALARHFISIGASGGTHLAFRARAVASGELVGYAEVARIDPEHGGCRLARVLIRPEQRGAGYGAALVDALARHCFIERGLSRVELEVYDVNHAALRCYERAGFVREGFRRAVVRFDGATWGSVLMACLRHEYRDVTGSADPSRD